MFIHTLISKPNTTKTDENKNNALEFEREHSLHIRTNSTMKDVNEWQRNIAIESTPPRVFIENTVHYCYETVTVTVTVNQI